MQRQTQPPFRMTPERNPIDSDDIELIDVNDFKQSSPPDEPDLHEPASPEATYCYAFQYAAEPFIAVTDAVRESIDEANIYTNPESLYERAANAGEYLNSVIAAPIAYASAAAVSVFGFFGGAARDIYHLTSNCSVPHEQNKEDNSTCSAKIQP